MFDGVEVRRIGRQEEPVTAGGLDQFQGGRRVMKAGVVQHDYAAWRQHGQQDLFKIDIHHLRVATTLKDQRRDQFPGLYHLLLFCGSIIIKLFYIKFSCPNMNRERIA
jgi:hypothetical protein